MLRTNVDHMKNGYVVCMALLHIRYLRVTLLPLSYHSEVGLGTYSVYIPEIRLGICMYSLCLTLNLLSGAMVKQ